jgi:hypothetical protein
MRVEKEPSVTKSMALAEIEQQVRQLSPDEQLWLIEQLVQGLRRRSAPAQADWAQELAAMAADPEIQRELRQIADEFGPTEADGLGQP